MENADSMKGAAEQMIEDKPADNGSKQQGVESAKANEGDAENQIAAVLTEMQNVSENIAAASEGEKPAEDSHQNYEPSIAVIVQDDQAASATQQTSHVNPAAQINLTPDQIEVMQSGQIPSQASLYSLGNIVLILSPDIMATAGGLTPEQIQQIQECQSSSFTENVQEGSTININLDGTQKEEPSLATTAEASKMTPTPKVVATTSTTSTTSTTNSSSVKNIVEQEKTPEKKDKESEEKSNSEVAVTAVKKDADKPVPKSTELATEDKTDSTKTVIEKENTSKDAAGSAEKRKTTTIQPIKKRYRGAQKKTGEDVEPTGEKGSEDIERSEEKEGSEKNRDENKDKEKEGKDKADTVKGQPAEIAVKCPNCSEIFSTKKELEDHSKTHNRRKRGRQPAKHTPETTRVTRPKRARKAESEAGKDDVSFQCEVCGEAFDKENKLRKHLTTHNVNKRLHCDGCKVPFAFQYQLEKHVRRNISDEPYKCEHCSETFKLRCHFNYHLRLHNPKKVHQCEHCDKTFNTFANLKGHTRIHTGEKPYKCEFCEKAFTEYSSLAKHRRAHTGERPFKCTQCEKGFSQSGGLKVHMRVHTGEKPYKCNFCERSFAKSYNLKTHTRTHTGEKPYKCSHCGKVFSQHSTLVQHVRRHDGKTPTTKATTAQQTTGNPETDIVERQEVAPTNSLLEVQIVQETEVPQANVEQQVIMETQPQLNDVSKTIETATLVALQQTVPQQPTEVVLNEKTQAEQIAALQEATQAIQMLQMQQLVQQVEEVVSQANFS